MRDLRDPGEAEDNRYGLALAVGFSLLLAAVFGAYFLFVINAGLSHKAGHERTILPAETQAVPH